MNARIITIAVVQVCFCADDFVVNPLDPPAVPPHGECCCSLFAGLVRPLLRRKYRRDIAALITISSCYNYGMNDDVNELQY